MLKPELAAVVGAERFLAEIETTANLQHPHILPLFDSGQVHPGGNFHAPSFAADGRRLAVDYNTADGRNVWVVDIEEGVASRATFVPNGHDARWNPDGVTLTYLADTEGPAQFGIFQSRPGSVEADSLIASRSISY